jgi:hypothetical protein
MAKVPAKPEAKPRPPKSSSFDVPALFANEVHVMSGPGFVRIGFAESSPSQTRYVSAVAMTAANALELSETLERLARQAIMQNVEHLRAEFGPEEDGEEGEAEDSENNADQS